MRIVLNIFLLVFIWGATWWLVLVYPSFDWLWFVAFVLSVFVLFLFSLFSSTRKKKQLSDVGSHPGTDPITLHYLGSSHSALNKGDDGGSGGGEVSLCVSKSIVNIRLSSMKHDQWHWELSQ